MNMFVDRVPAPETMVKQSRLNSLLLSAAAGPCPPIQNLLHSFPIWTLQTLWAPLTNSRTLPAPLRPPKSNKATRHSTAWQPGYTFLLVIGGGFTARANLGIAPPLPCLGSAALGTRCLNPRIAAREPQNPILDQANKYTKNSSPLTKQDGASVQQDALCAFFSQRLGHKEVARSRRAFTSSTHPLSTAVRVQPGGESTNKLVPKETQHDFTLPANRYEDEGGDEDDNGLEAVDNHPVKHRADPPSPSRTHLDFRPKAGPSSKEANRSRKNAPSSN